MNVPSLILCFFASYLLGSIPWGYLLVRWFKGIDIRRQGSGNIGFTNVLRTAGKPLGVLTLALDAGKGYAAVALLAPYLAGTGGGSDLFAIAAFVGAVLGHVFTPFLRFRGGKGIADGAGALLALSPTAFAVCLGLWLAVVAGTRYVSLASVVAAAALPPAVYYFERATKLSIFAGLVAALVIFRHAGNIRRLLEGKERRIGEKTVTEEEVISN
ncbi:MAG: glycerol-3-phosphate 1-O-acyltransferase PlsY [Candidatus Aureabacteria bacterium]|nr:glycerol-3-phosphate 1-O-acyltransferase PlsY [Candidatus Auribacterota bacterium]